MDWTHAMRSMTACNLKHAPWRPCGSSPSTRQETGVPRRVCSVLLRDSETPLPDAPKIKCQLFIICDERAAQRQLRSPWLRRFSSRGSAIRCPYALSAGLPSTVDSGQIEIAQCQAPIIGHKVIIACPVLVRDVGSLELRGDAFVLLGKGARCWQRRGAAEQS
eukprot:scaffold77208_cov72-Phaeocystis_antarctica.AAC.5